MTMVLEFCLTFISSSLSALVYFLHVVVRYLDLVGILVISRNKSSQIGQFSKYVCLNTGPTEMVFIVHRCGRCPGQII